MTEEELKAQIADRDMPNPTPEQLNDPVFKAIWETIKSWDINVPEYYQGYCGATGSHVILIINALKRAAVDIIAE
jgi:hypothetical protein